MGAVRRNRKGMASVRAIASYWNLPYQFCWRCGNEEVPLDRAHVVDRSLGGLDSAQNLGLLCYSCHVQMPSVSPEDWKAGMAYIFVEYFPSFVRDALSTSMESARGRHPRRWRPCR